jgi:hypothetical protein
MLNKSDGLQKFRCFKIFHLISGKKSRHLDRVITFFYNYDTNSILYILQRGAYLNKYRYIIFYNSVQSGSVVLWCCGNVVLWYCGAVVM